MCDIDKGCVICVCVTVTKGAGFVCVTVTRGACMCVTVIPAGGECWGEKRDMCVAETECEDDICSKFSAWHLHSFIELS